MSPSNETFRELHLAADHYEMTDKAMRRNWPTPPQSLVATWNNARRRLDRAKQSARKHIV